MNDYFSASICVNLRFEFVEYLKKQSQFADGQIGVNSYIKGLYGKILICGAAKNKAKQTQII